MDYIGRQGKIHWYPTDSWHRARLVDYDAVSGAHNVVWYDEWRHSELYLGGISNSGEGVHGFRPDRARPQRRNLAGQRVILEPDHPQVLEVQGNPAATTDFRACVLKRAEDFPAGRGRAFYHIFYLQSQIIVTANLAQVRFEVIDHEDRCAQLDEPMQLSPLDDYIGTGPVYDLQIFSLILLNE